jgi:CO/xanthine dehydrogenase FAD-binding subunit
MRAFGYTVADSPADAVQIVAGTPNSTFVAGGTDLLNLMKDDVEPHDHLVDVNQLDIAGVVAGDTGLRVGGLARMRQVAEHPVVRRDYPVLSQALLASASPQVRNMAAIGGTCCSAPDAATSGIPARRVTSATPAPVAQRSPGTAGDTRSSAVATTASLRIPRTWQWRWWLWTRPCTYSARTATEPSP